MGNRKSRNGRGVVGSTGRRTAAIVAAGLSGLIAGGCEQDSYLFDQSVVGRWEHTPSSAPILRRIAAIEGPEDAFVQVTSATSSDLVPEVEEYRLGPGDVLRITLWDLPDKDDISSYERTVDPRGYVDLPQLGLVNVSGRTVESATDVVQNSMRGQLANPLAAVEVITARQGTYTVLGSVGSPGPYFLPTANFRLLDALAAAGGFPESTPEVFVIRQIPLTDEAAGRPADEARGQTPRPPEPPPTGENLLDVIDDLTGQPRDGGAKPEPSPATFDGGWQPPAGVLDPSARQPVEPPPPADDGSTWIYLDGKWVKVKSTAAAADAAPQAGGDTDTLFTQRVIRIPVPPLIAGDARLNVVVRPGDVIRVPTAPVGNIFLGGQISRPGAFQISENLTLMRVIDAAGGLNQIAVPERVDLVRMLPGDRQATIRLNLRAINEMTQPDIYLKVNDRINVGTNFWALPLSAVRNGFRATYGFGLLLDRNFGTDVFGAPPRDNSF